MNRFHDALGTASKERDTDMNTNTNKNNNPRFVCENWDRPEVVIEGHGKGRHPIRKVSE